MKLTPEEAKAAWANREATELLRTSDGMSHLMADGRCSLCGLTAVELADALFDQQQADRADFEAGMP